MDTLWSFHLSMPMIAAYITVLFYILVPVIGYLMNTKLMDYIIRYFIDKVVMEDENLLEEKKNIILNKDGITGKLNKFKEEYKNNCYVLEAGLLEIIRLYRGYLGEFVFYDKLYTVKCRKLITEILEGNENEFKGKSSRLRINEEAHQRFEEKVPPLNVDIEKQFSKMAGREYMYGAQTEKSEDELLEFIMESIENGENNYDLIKLPHMLFRYTEIIIKELKTNRGYRRHYIAELEESNLDIKLWSGAMNYIIEERETIIKNICKISSEYNIRTTFSA